MAGNPDLEHFLANLSALDEAIGVVQRESTSIKETMASIEAKMKEIGTDWSSPSFMTFDDMQKWFNTAQNDLSNVLEDILNRMRTSYWNYHNAEAANLSNIGDGDYRA
ncbi:MULTISPECIES: WXG100 family type VII secretion target [Streptomyces]|uniref:WXG100 family type VII secretion target n=1 Tax=Streptomyces cacaoi TaxID=1898 RepID=A0A4Y3R9R3_STRCI|nr:MULTISPECIES: WXG100 family type VII secretion target [Streptomyces]NNG88106.1 hypothetical protein [Streptomyces cacaoi]QHF96106.1 hypothetical protein DEH18_22130 [Streptomyces sp. NHF165]GEB54194.1 hypothetical protein SCA03_67450 [Streptomyces cacaoi]